MGDAVCKFFPFADLRRGHDSDKIDIRTEKWENIQLRAVRMIQEQIAVVMHKKEAVTVTNAFLPCDNAIWIPRHPFCI